jgi:GxxExxY protein
MNPEGTPHHGDTETRRKLVLEDLTEKIIGAAIEVHKELGPGLLESAYEECLCYELHLRGISFRQQVPLPLQYRGRKVGFGYTLDIIVGDAVILEVKCVEKILPIHEAQLLTYLRMTGKKVGFVINFNVAVLSRGLVRKV